MQALTAAQGRLRTDLSRINALIADNASARAALEESHLALSGQAGRELAQMEEEATRLKSAVEQGARDKADILAGGCGALCGAVVVVTCVLMSLLLYSVA